MKLRGASLRTSVLTEGRKKGKKEGRKEIEERKKERKKERKERTNEGTNESVNGLMYGWMDGWMDMFSLKLDEYFYMAAIRGPESFCNRPRALQIFPTRVCLQNLANLMTLAERIFVKKHGIEQNTYLYLNYEL